MERPYIELSRKAAIAGGFPHPQPTLSAESMAPPPPNAFGAMSGVSGLLAGLAGQAQPHAKGGHVRRGYAAGDSVARAASQFQQLRGHIHESPEEAEMRESAQHFKNYRANPMADYLMTAGAHQLANLNKGPMQSFGEGATQGIQAFKEAQGRNLSAQEKYHNLISKINQSKVNQHQFLSQYHANMQNQEEMQRQHNIHNAETKRAHDMMYSRAAEAQEKPIKMSATEKKLEHDAQKDLLRAVRMKKELSNLSGLVKQTSSGPLVGFGKKIIPKTKIDNQIEVATNKLILDMHQGMKNIPRSEEFLKRIETTKPNTMNYPEANQEALAMMDQGANDVLEHSISALLSAGWSPEKIEKRFKIKVPPHFLEGEVPEEESLENEPEHGGVVSMIDPNGNPLSVPKSEVNEALRLGANYG
ncbi:MAG TPA: hypothetical protein VNZ45_01145, partial [Bacteroidia bacterium]|nr:hypothetical protein [Bacteroidia bacterium]